MVITAAAKAEAEAEAKDDDDDEDADDEVDAGDSVADANVDREADKNNSFVAQYTSAITQTVGGRQVTLQKLVADVEFMALVDKYLQLPFCCLRVTQNTFCVMKSFRKSLKQYFGNGLRYLHQLCQRYEKEGKHLFLV